MSRSRIFKSALVGTVAALALAGSAFGQVRSFDVPAGDLKVALDTYIRQAGVQLIYRTEDVRGKSTRGVHGALAPEPALEQLLAGSGVVATRDRSGAIVVAKRPQGEAGAPPASEASQVEGSTQLGEIVVTTGSRIRGARPSSPVIRLSQDDMRNAGESNLGDAIRNLPQNFNGGQSPSIGQGAGQNNVNGNSTSQLNLRGLGPDATLTLLNGRRLAYNSVRQGVDITAIPLDAVDRLEIVADGASALYGSDAVGGVANVILKRDYDGLSTTVRFGTATDGGNTQQQYSIVGGRTWVGGGIVATANYEKSTAITARQRSYTSMQDDTTILYPPIEASAGVVSAHQDLSKSITLNIDALYNSRSTFSASPNTATAAYKINGSAFNSDLHSYLISPNIDFALKGSWRANASYVYGRDKNDQLGFFWANGTASLPQATVYTNTTQVFELTAEGRLIALPAGDVRLAVGGGYRQVELAVSRGATASAVATKFAVNQDARYGFGEVNIPLTRDGKGVPVPGTLTATMAARYEDYPGMDQVLVPKVGITYAPVPDFELMASWGKSFKAPVLNQQYAAETDILRNAVTAGGVGYPAQSTVLQRTGGNPDVTPERATSWTLTGTLRPRFAPSAKLAVSYFHIDYTDRIAQPFASSAGALSNPLYTGFVTLNPGAATIQSIVANSGTVLQNGSGFPYDPNKVVAILDMRVQNIAEQRIEGVDVSADYQFDGGAFGSFTTMGSLAYISSKQRLLAGQPSADLSGVIFNPPKIRARLGLIWQAGDVSLSPFVNYSGRLTDNRLAPIYQISDQVTVDVTARFHIHSDLPALHDLEILASLINITNEAPKSIRTTRIDNTPYESTNYSPVGRFVSLSIVRRW